MDDDDPRTKETIPKESCMKTTLITLALLILIMLFLAQVSIEFNPFKITFGRPYFAIGWILIIIGVAFIQIDSERKGRKEKLEEVIKQIKDENNHRTPVQ